MKKIKNEKQTYFNIEINIEMSFPVRCFTCNKIIGAYETKYNKAIEKGENPSIVLDKLGMNRYCCRRMFLGYVDIGEKILAFPKNVCKE